MKHTQEKLSSKKRVLAYNILVFFILSFLFSSLALSYPKKASALRDSLIASYRSIALNIIPVFAQSCNPATPTGLDPSGTKTPGTYTFRWNAVSGVAGYFLRINDEIDPWYTGGSDVAVTLNGVNNTSYNFTIKAGHNYGWWVHSFCNASDPYGSYGPASSANVSCVAPTPTPIPPTPTPEQGEDNLALNKPAVASGEHGGNSPNRAVDGNTGTGWNSGGYAPKWIRIDLGSNYLIDKVRLLAEGLPVGTVYYSIQGSLDNSSYTAILSNAHTISDRSTWGEHTFTPVTVRYVRINATNWAGSWVAIREVEVYSPTPTPTPEPRYLCRDTFSIPTPTNTPTPTPTETPTPTPTLTTTPTPTNTPTPTPTETPTPTPTPTPVPCGYTPCDDTTAPCESGLTCLETVSGNYCSMTNPEIQDACYANPSDTTCCTLPTSTPTITPTPTPTITPTPTTTSGPCVLEISKTVDKTSAVPGDELAYTINFRNAGTGYCTGGGVRVKDVVDTNLEYLREGHSSDVDRGYGSFGAPYDSGDRGLRWDANELGPGESGWVKWYARVKTPSTCGNFDISNQAHIASIEYDSDCPGDNCRYCSPEPRIWVDSNQVKASVIYLCVGVGAASVPSSSTFNISVKSESDWRGLRVRFDWNKIPKISSVVSRLHILRWDNPSASRITDDIPQNRRYSRRHTHGISSTSSTDTKITRNVSYYYKFCVQLKINDQFVCSDVVKIEGGTPSEQAIQVTLPLVPGPVLGVSTNPETNIMDKIIEFIFGEGE